MTSAERKRHRRDARALLREQGIDVAPALEEAIARLLAHNARAERAQVAGFVRDTAGRAFLHSMDSLRRMADAIEHAERDADGGIPFRVNDRR